MSTESDSNNDTETKSNASKSKLPPIQSSHNENSNNGTTTKKRKASLVESSDSDTKKASNAGKSKTSIIDSSDSENEEIVDSSTSESEEEHPKKKTKSKSKSSMEISDASTSESEEEHPKKKTRSKSKSSMEIPDSSTSESEEEHLKKKTKSKTKSSDEKSKTTSLKEKKKEMPKKKPIVRKSGTAKKPEAELKKMICEFVMSKSRPYTSSELVLTFKNEGTKNEILKILNDLSDAKKFIKKEFGKTIVFLGAIQFSNMPEEEISRIRNENEECIKEIKVIKDEIDLIGLEIKKECEFPKDDDLENFIKEKLEEIEENKKRFSGLADGRIKVEKEDMVKIDKLVMKYKKILKERNLMFKNAFDVLLENSGMKKNEFREEIGLEDDK